jgi:large conductance mechanosensitive channel
MVEIKKPKFLDDFKAFITKGNMMDLAVGIIIGVAFGAVITSLVNDVLMPPIGMALGGVDFKEWYLLLKEGTVGGPYPSLSAAQADGAVTLRWGAFINAIINFLIIAMVIFVIIKMIARMRRKEEAKEPTTRACPHCDTQISINASRCPNCTSDVTPETKKEARAIKKQAAKDAEEAPDEDDEEDEDDKDEDDEDDK